MQNISQKNIISHPLHPAGHQAQHGGVRLRGAKVGTNGTRTGGKTTNGQTNGEIRQHGTHVTIVAGNSMRRRQAQRCQLVSLTAVLLLFSTEVAESEFRTQPVATAVNGTRGVDTVPSCTRADAHSSRAHITVHNSVIDPHSSNVVTSALSRDTKGSVSLISQKHFHLFVLSLLGVPFVRFPTCSLSRPSGSSSSLERTR